MDGERLYKLSTVADNLDLNVRTVQKYAREGKLRTVRVGPMRLLRVREIDFKTFKDSESGHSDPKS
jgi:excisionase family DNA binding protein